MNWMELKETIYYGDGSWRDIHVAPATRDLWRKWINYVNENYRVAWFNPKIQQLENKIDPAVIEEWWNGKDDFLSTANVYIDNIQINAHFFDDHEFENDIDPREFNEINDHLKLVRYLTDLSNLFNGPVSVTPENEHETVLLKVDGNNIIYK